MITQSHSVVVREPLIARKLFSEAGPWSLVWLVVRLYVGWEWASAGWGKIMGAGAHPWGPESLRAFWERVVAIPAAPAKASITYDWYRSFLEALLNMNAESWMAPLVAWGELLVGVALILGIFTGIAAFFGAFMNMNFMLAGSASTNPVLFFLGILLVLAWKTAGWWGVDRWLLTRLGTPWASVVYEQKSDGGGASV